MEDGTTNPGFAGFSADNFTPKPEWMAPKPEEGPAAENMTQIVVAAGRSADVELEGQMSEGDMSSIMEGVMNNPEGASMV